MHLTKEDQKRIEKQAEQVAYRINAEASEYANLYEREYYKALIQKLEAKIWASEEYEKIMKSK